jgi:hypothetical protein
MLSLTSWIILPQSTATLQVWNEVIIWLYQRAHGKYWRYYPCWSNRRATTNPKWMLLRCKTVLLASSPRFQMLLKMKKKGNVTCEFCNDTVLALWMQPIWNTLPTTFLSRVCKKFNEKIKSCK